MPELALQQVMESLPQRFQASKAAGMDAVVQYRLVGEQGGDWYLTIHDQTCQVAPGQAPAPNATLEVESGDFLNILAGQAEEIGWAFMQGRMVVTGDLRSVWRTFSLFAR